MTEPLVEFRGVELTFDQPVLRDVNLRVEPNERLVVLGQSGSGKSTLLRLLLGILSPTSGEVLFEGDDIGRMSRRKLNRVRRRIGMVHQYSALISSVNVRENLSMPLEELTDKPEDEITRLVEETLRSVGMAEAADKFPSELSGGMKKRVGLARALVLGPDLILFDEPSAGLDPVISTLIDRLIINLSEERSVTSIIVTHEMESAFHIATRMAMLYEGEIVFEAPPDEFRKSKHPVVAQFVTGSIEGPIQTDADFST